jgi:hypothetical protein
MAELAAAIHPLRQAAKLSHGPAAKGMSGCMAGRLVEGVIAKNPSIATVQTECKPRVVHADMHA